MTDLIDVDKVNEVLSEIVSEFGEDYVYPGKDGNGRERSVTVGDDGCACTNSDGTPSCIVGHLMDRLGTPRPKHGTRDNAAPFGSAFLNSGYRDAYTPLAVARLRQVQWRQDQGYSWGGAVK